MRRGPVQDRTVPLLRQQTLSTARRHSLSELFQLLLRAVVKKKKRAVSAEGEGPATAETTDLLVPSRLLRVREAWNPKLNMQNRDREERAGLPQGPPPSSRSR